MSTLKNFCSHLTLLLTWSFLCLCVLLPLRATAQPRVLHARMGDSCTTTDRQLTLHMYTKHQQFDWKQPSTLDRDIFSPKSVKILPHQSKYYVHSLEGCATIVYDLNTHKKLKVIHHLSNEQKRSLWAKPSGLFPFRKYHNHTYTFEGKPVESTLTHNGKYLWVTYYKRSFDINAQDPSAIAIIDTHRDSIIRWIECGPLPKMITTSNDGKQVAVTHWGDNTVGFIDCSSNNPRQWHYTSLVTVLQKFTPNFSTTQAEDRDKNSGLKLRGTVFLPGDRYLLVACMTGGYGIGVIDVKTHEYLGRLTGMYPTPRHLLISNNYLYCSCNASGYVAKTSLTDIFKAIEELRPDKKVVSLDWHNCKVYPGARTIVASPNGKYIFVVCNTASKLVVIDAHQMHTVGEITLDSFPVGLALSNDGQYLITTSQGIQHKGGNAVNIIRLKANHKWAILSAPNTIHSRPQQKPIASTNLPSNARLHTPMLYGIISILAIVWITILCILLIYKKRKKNYKQKL